MVKHRDREAVIFSLLQRESATAEVNDHPEDFTTPAMQLIPLDPLILLVSGHSIRSEIEITVLVQRPAFPFGDLF